MKKYIVFGLVIFMAMCFQTAFILSESIQTPQKVLITFCKAYFNLDESVASMVTEEARIQDGIDLIQTYQDRMKKIARDKGYRESYSKSCLSNIFTETIRKDDKEVEIKIVADRTFLVKWLMTGQKDKIDTTLKLINTKDGWKISDGLISLQ